ncbi:T9SS type A sorting domain-containing protein [Roseivirga sp. BDSF3-8]|uniref:T9SS type A sorting domain-containing protein n=1 Tax=Roseivirga sp. BDSF3-8 TaxID=3241598 RepID=UPI0035327094
MRKIYLFILLTMTVGTVLGQKAMELQRYQAPGDPNLDPNWDWTVSSPVTMYYSPNGSTVTQINNRYVPFWTSGNELAADKDMHPEDGWVLAWKDFGTPTDAPALPFFVLYNKYRGTLRFMIYNATNISHTFFKGELSFRNDSDKYPLFTHTAKDKVFGWDFNDTQTEVYLGEGAAYNNWFYLDFVMFGYRDNMSFGNTILHLEVHGVDESQVSLNGSISLEQQLKESTVGNGKDVGESVIGALEKGHKYYKGVENFRSDMEKAGTKHKDDTWWGQPLLNVMSAGVSTALPVVGGVVGLISSFIGGKSTPAPREPISFLGEMDLSGKITTTVPLLNADFKLSPGNQAPDKYSTVQAIDWGVFSALFPPRIQVTQVEECREDWYYGNLTCYNSHGVLEMHQQVMPYDFNNDIGMSIVSMEAAYVWDNKEGFDYLPWSTFKTKSYQIGYYDEPDGISYKITFKINSPTINSDDEIVMVKTIPIDLTYLRGCEGDCRYRVAQNDGPNKVKEELPLSQEVTLHPNPATDQVTVSIPATVAGNGQVMLMDAMGRKVLSERISLLPGMTSYQLQADQVGALEAGIYMVVIKTPSGLYKNKLIIE